MAASLLSRVMCSHCRHVRLLPRKLTPGHSPTPHRGYAGSGYSFLNVNRDTDNKDIAVLELDRKPINSLTLEFTQEICEAFKELESDKSCRAVILASSCSVFSAGLDISTELHQPQSEARLRAFMLAFEEIAVRIRGSDMVTVAAINGACPGAGSALALCCDYRVMAEGKHSIGVAASLLGICPPYWIRRLVSEIAGARRADYMLQLGAQFSPQRALVAGVVDEVVTGDGLMAAARGCAEGWLKVLDAGRTLTKQQLRRPFLEDVAANSASDVETFVSLILRPETQQSIGRYLDTVRSKNGR